MGVTFYLLSEAEWCYWTKVHDVMLQGAPVSPPQDPHGALLLGAAHRPLLAHHGIAAGPERGLSISTISISYLHLFIYSRIWYGQIILSLCSPSFASARSLSDIFISPPSSGCFWKVLNLSCLSLQSCFFRRQIKIFVWNSDYLWTWSVSNIIRQSHVIDVRN